MELKEKIVALLTKSAGDFVSGEFLARECGVSRGAVWKAISAIRAEGYEIEAKTNIGYRLLSDAVSAGGIASLLCEPLSSRLRVEAYARVDSTNLRVRERAASGEAEGLVICAASQSAGRGRLGRSFYSPGGTGLYMSVLLRPALCAATGITTAAAVAVCRAIASTLGIEAGIKWVNDVFVGGRKVCGILTEAATSVESGSIEYAVLGIGVNVSEPRRGFPPEIADVAGALVPEARPGTASALAAAILTEFFALYDRLGENPQIEEYRRRSVILGRRVTVVPLAGGDERGAIAEAITDSAALVVRFDDGSVETLTSGEVRVTL